MKKKKLTGDIKGKYKVEINKKLIVFTDNPNENEVRERYENKDKERLRFRGLRTNEISKKR